jgi:hypothetical protein
VKKRRTDRDDGLLTQKEGEVPMSFKRAAGGASSVPSWRTAKGPKRPAKIAEGTLAVEYARGSLYKIFNQANINTLALHSGQQTKKASFSAQPAISLSSKVHQPSHVICFATQSRGPALASGGPFGY